MTKIDDEYQDIPDRSKRYALRHPEKWKLKQEKYLKTAQAKYLRHQAYLDHGIHWAKTKDALKQVVKRYIAMEFRNQWQWINQNSFDGKWLESRIVLVSDFEDYLKDRTKYYSKLKAYKY